MLSCLRDGAYKTPVMCKGFKEYGNSIRSGHCIIL